MKTNGRKAAQLERGNKLWLEGILMKYKLQQTEFGLYVLIADMMDEIAGGASLSMYIGATKNKSAFAVYINGEEPYDGLFAVSLPDLSQAALDML